MDRRTEEQKLRGVVPVVWAGEVREVPTLKRGPARLWKDRLAGLVGEVSGVPVSSPDALAAAGNLASDRMLDLVLEYDQGKVLGTREWVDDHVDDSEVYAALRAFLDVVYPFVTDIRGLLAEARTLLGSQSASVNSTSSPSPSGDSTPRRSRRS